MEHPILKLLQKPSRIVLGFMSGTSADGVDAALCRITGCCLTTQVEQLSFTFVPFPQEVRDEILRLASGETACAADFCRINFLLGQLYCEAGEAACQEAGIPKAQVDLIGNHGQTLWHIPVEEEYLGRRQRSTLQLGEDALLAECFGCPVVGDFRVRDMAAGGLGAPLVPYTEFLLYRRPDEWVALQNIGGIGNVTVLPANCTLDQVFAFDTGPGNMVIDAVISRLTNGRMTYDDGGAMAAQGKLHPELLRWMLDDPYLSKKPPKTTGRELYGPVYVDRLMEKAGTLNVAPADLMNTVTQFTAETIAYGLRRFSPQLPQRLIVGGGGSLNRCLMEQLRGLRPRAAGDRARGRGGAAGMPRHDQRGSGAEQQRQGGGGLRRAGQRNHLRKLQQRALRHRCPSSRRDGKDQSLRRSASATRPSARLSSLSAQQHHNGRLAVIIAAFQRLHGLSLRLACRFAHDRDAAADELFVGGLHIHHQVAVHLAQPDHRAGGQHIQDHLLGRAALHAGRAGDHLRARRGGDANIRRFIHLRAGAAADADDRRAQLFGVFHRAQHIGGAAAGCNAHQHVLFGEPNALQILCAQLPVVLRAFHGLINGGHSAGDQALHHFRLRRVGRRTFHRVQNAQTARSAAAHIDQPSALPEPFGDRVHRLGDLGTDSLHGFGDLVVLAVDELHHLQCAQLVDVGGAGVALFRCDLA